jgi:hypothetical protein
MSDEVGARKWHKVENGPVEIEANPSTPSVWVGDKKQVELLADGAGGLRLRAANGDEGCTFRGTSVGFNVHDASGDEVLHLETALHRFVIGGTDKNAAGELGLRDDAGNVAAVFQGATGGFTVGSSMRFETADESAILRVGDGGRNGVIRLRNAAGQLTVLLDGGAGDITLPNADCAEDFDADSDAIAAPGMIVVLDDAGRVVPCESEYDERVAGVVSGAGAYRAGVVLDRRPRTGPRATVALVGKVFCWVDADVAPIRVGTQITTSVRRGHGRAVVDRGRGLGAIVGKALAPLAIGQALIPVLVTLR